MDFERYSCYGETFLKMHARKIWSDFVAKNNGNV